jgi:hypothetical protein
VRKSFESIHSADRQWWWNGESWLPAWTADRRWWFDGHVWIRAVQPVRRWMQRAGFAAFLGGLVALMVGGVSVMGDPEPGGTVTGYSWSTPVAALGAIAMAGGVTLILRSRVARHASS